MNINLMGLLGLLVLVCVSLLIYIFFQRREVLFYKREQAELDEYAAEVEAIYRQLSGYNYSHR